MAYTASAISFMLSNLQAPVIFTGSQRPLNFARTDALQNIFSAITMAASGYLGLKPVIREVSVYSYDTLFRGNRASMVNASSYRTYDSPNFPPLASVGEHIEIQSHLIRPSGESKVLAANIKIDAEVVILDVFPGMRAGIIKGLAKNVESAKESRDVSQIRGVLLRTYGMGTAPTSPAFLDALQKLNESEIVVMNVTQARSGRISHGQDPVSLRLFEHGVISGVDMTAEAAYAKMVVLLSQEEDFHRVSDLLQIERSGEQSQSIFHIHFNANQTRDDESSEGYRGILRPAREADEFHLLRNNIERVSYIQLRLLGLEPVTPDNKPVTRTIELDVELVDPTQKRNSAPVHLKHDLLRWSVKGRKTINIAYDITEAKDRLLSKNQIPSTDLQLRTGEEVRWKRASIAIFTTVAEGM
jgi:L-asparaginase